MPNIDYLQIFRDAWKIIWKNRFLWWFGFLVALPGIFNLQYLPNTDKDSDFQIVWKKISESELDLSFLESFLANENFFPILVGILLLLILVSILLSLLGRGALIKSAQHILRSEPTSLKTGFREGKKYFGKIFAILFFSGLAIAACILILVVPILILIGTQNYFPAIVLGILAFFILIPLVILYKYVAIYACYYSVLTDLRPWLAVENAYTTLKKNFFPSIIMSLLFLPLGILAFLVFALIVIITLVLFVPLGFLLFASLQKTGLLITASLGIPFFLALLLFSSSVINTFYEVSWILFFYKIAGPKENNEMNKEKIEEEVIKDKLPTPEAIKTTQKSKPL